VGGRLGVRDLSLHILDVMENSVRAGASVIVFTMTLDREADLVTMTVEDNGSGLAVPPEVAVDPFYTTKRGKRTGLGLALLKGAAERAGGRLVIGRSSLGGASVTATMGLTHLDRSPLGDLGETVAALVCTHPEVDLRLCFRAAGVAVEATSAEVAARVPEGGRGAIARAQLWRNMLKNCREI
jgi:anti-sigma regulatory factor (Ser/Thr protein kinase)